MTNTIPDKPDDIYSKKRIHLTITKNQNEYLIEKANEYGISISEMVRRILDWYIERKLELTS